MNLGNIKKVIAISALLLVVVAFTGLPLANAQQPPREKILVFQYKFQPSYFNPLATGRDIEMLRTFLPVLQEQLLYVLITGSLVPWLAKSWELLDGGKRIIFHLDERAKWSDGNPVTAYDFEYGYNLSQLVTTPAGPAILQSVKALDEHTLEFNATQYNKRWALEWGGMAPLPMHQWTQIMAELEERAAKENKTASPLDVNFIDKPGEYITSGPFLYDSYKEGEWFFFRTRDDYWKPEFKPQIAGILYILVNDPTAVVTRFFTGELDCIEVSLDNIDVVVAGSPGVNVKVWKFPIPSATEYLAINTRLYPLNITEVRRAIDLAIDKIKIAQKYFLGYATPANRSLVNFDLMPKAYVPEAVWPGFTKTHAQCVAEANQILNSLGFLDTNGDGVRETPDGKPLEFTYIVQTLFNFRINAAEEITKNLAEIGIKVTVQAPDMLTGFVQVFFAANKTFGFFQGTYGEYPDAWYCQIYNFLLPPVGLSLTMATGYENPELDILSENAIRSMTDSDFYGNLTEHIKIFAQDLPVIPICFYQMQMFAYREDKLVNWNWDACAVTNAFGYPMPIRPLLVNMLIPVSNVLEKAGISIGEQAAGAGGLTTQQLLIIVAVIVVVVIAISAYVIKRSKKTSG